MTENVPREDMEPFENPDLLPLEELKLTIKNDGIVRKVDALSKTWVSERYFLHYEALKMYNDEGGEIIGVKDYWIEVANYMIDDLKWLLGLPYYRFWSNIVFNTSIMDALVSFLQDAPPFYTLENFPNCPQMLELLETLRRYVLLVFTRLVTNKESPAEYMKRSFLGNLLYEKYIFTVPIIFDLSQLYGRENAKIIGKILNSLFALEPRYSDDVMKTVPCLIEAMENVEWKFTGSMKYTNEATSLLDRDTGPRKLTLFQLEDMILYMLDIASTIHVFLQNYPPAVSIFHREDFMNKIVSMYESTIPEMYKNLDTLGCNEENMPKYMELKHRLDVTRVEILNLFRILIYESIQNIYDNLSTQAEADVKQSVEQYLTFLTNAISEKEFITDYNQFYPVELDLAVLSQICPEVDTIKCDYILQSISANMGKHNTSSVASSSNVGEAAAGPSGVQSQSVSSFNDTSSSNPQKPNVMKKSVKLSSLISEVKDILYHLDEHFIEMCLEHYNYDTASVINAVLGETLPAKLKELKDLEPATNSVQTSVPPADYLETDSEDLAVGIEDLGIFDDEDMVFNRVREDIPVPKEYISRNYGLVADDYDDEYDDSFDHHNVYSRTQDDTVEMNSRPFTTPRVLLGKQNVETAKESESEDESTVAEQNGKDHFLQNPADIRARAEEQRQAMRGRRGAPNVVGKSKGRGQEKSVTYSRQQKNTHKATHANHNRRSGARWKRNQGMVPS